MGKIQNNTSVNHQMQNYTQLNTVNSRPKYTNVINLNESCDTVELSSKKKKKKTILGIIAGTLSAGAIIACILKCKNKTKQIQNLEVLANNIPNLTDCKPTIIETQLEELAQKLSDEYKSFGSESRKITAQFIFGSDETSANVYENLKTRTKGKDSILSKLKAKYNAGKLTLSQNFDENLAKARALINDAYGSRLLLEGVTQKDYQRILDSHNVNQEDFLAKIIELMKNPETKIDETYLEIIEELKELQTKDIFETLLNGIKNKTITIEKFENYGDTISSYFSKKQIAQLVDTYAENNDGKILAIVSKDASGIIEHSKTLPKNIEILDDEQLLSPETYHTTSENKKIKTIQEAITADGAVKKSGYTTTQMDVRQNFSQGKGMGEFQIRGSKVNDFGDVEHIPYDIRQGKITEDDVEYREIYNIIKGMSDKQYKGYNKYLTEVYTYLRLQELGLNPGAMPALDSTIGPFEISYQGLLKFAHK